MIRKKLFPFLVFSLLLVLVESAIALLIHINRPEDIPVTRVITGFGFSSQIIDPAAVDAFMVDTLRRTGLAGAILAISKNDQILYTAGYGYTSKGLRITADTPMPIASLTKSFTAAGIMQLVEAGKLGLQNPVQEYLPEFELADPRGRQITIRQLLNQTSGLGTQGLPPEPSRLPKSLAERIQWLRAATLLSDPGKKFQYCNDNFNVLARAIERVSGEPYAKFLENHLLGPMNMHSTRFYLTTREPMPGVDAGYKLLYGALIARQMPDEVAGGAGGIVSSANDLARWLVLHSTGGKSAEGKTILSPESIAAMHTASAPGSNYGFGWRQESLPDGTKTVHHSGKQQTFNAHQRLFPQTGYAYAFVINADHSFNAEAASFISGLNAIIAGRKPTIPPGAITFGLPFSLVVDNVAAILSIFVLTIGIVGSVRAPDWAVRRAKEPSWRVASRFVPYALLSMSIIVLPWLMGAMNRGVSPSLGVLFSVWPPLVILFVAASASGISVFALRMICITSVKRRGR